jgi:hypothetical protein
MNSALEWFATESAGAPEALRARAARYLERFPGRSGVPETLASAAGAALRDTLAQEGNRSIALDLLAADALVTLALKAMAQRAPGNLAAFAAGLREAGAAPR